MLKPSSQLFMQYMLVYVCAFEFMHHRVHEYAQTDVIYL